MTKTKTTIAATVSEILNIPDVVRAVMVNFSGNSGKTTVGRHLLIPVLPGVELVRIETINSSGSSEADVELTGKQFEAVAKMLYETDHHMLVDIGASNVEAVKQVLYRVAGAHRFVDMWVVPCMPTKKMVTDTIATLKELLKIGVPASAIVVIKNRVNDVDTMDADFAELQAVTNVLDVRMIDRPMLDYDLYGEMDHLQGSLDDLLADTTDHRGAMLAARRAGDTKAADEATAADFRRMNAETAVENLRKLRRDIFGVVKAPAMADPAA